MIILFFIFGAGETGEFFIRMGLSAYSSAIGCYSVGSNDVFAVEENPAKGAHLIRKQAGFSLIKGFMDFSSGGVAFLYPKKFVYGFLIKEAGVKDIQSYDEKGTKTGSFDISEKIFAFSISKKLTGITDNFVNTGLTLKYVNEDFRYSAASSFLFSLGLYYKYALTHGFEAGVVFSDYGQGFKFFDEYSSPPSRFSIGFGYTFKVFTMDTFSHFIEFASNSSSINYGFEYNLWKLWKVRAGFNGAKILGPRVSYGFGFRIKNVSIDFSTQNFGFLTDIHRIVVIYSF